MCIDDTQRICSLTFSAVSLRPCRKILNDLSSDVPAVPKIEEEKSEDDSAPAITTVTMPTPIYQTSSGQYSECLSRDALLPAFGHDGRWC